MQHLLHTIHLLHVTNYTSQRIILLQQALKVLWAAKASMLDCNMLFDAKID